MKRRRETPDMSSPRARIAAEAARMLARGEASSGERARRKAARKLGIDEPSLQPSDAEVAEALRDYQRLFGEADDLPSLAQLEQAAGEALQHFAGFTPELCGGLAEQPPRREPVIHLLLYVDDPDAPLHRLLEEGIPHRVRRGSLYADGLGALSVDHLELTAGGVDILLTPLPLRCRGAALRRSVHAEPLPRVGASSWKRRRA